MNEWKIHYEMTALRLRRSIRYSDNLLRIQNYLERYELDVPVSRFNLIANDMTSFSTGQYLVTYYS